MESLPFVVDQRLLAPVEPITNQTIGYFHAVNVYAQTGNELNANGPP